MKTFQIVSFFAFVTAAMAFAPAEVPKGECPRSEESRTNELLLGETLRRGPDP
jgi:hypothetical protein